MCGSKFPLGHPTSSGFTQHVQEAGGGGSRQEAVRRQPGAKEGEKKMRKASTTEAFLCFVGNSLPLYLRKIAKRRKKYTFRLRIGKNTSTLLGKIEGTIDFDTIFTTVL